MSDKKHEFRTVILYCRVSPRERDKILSICYRHKLTISKYIRNMILGEDDLMRDVIREVNDAKKEKK